MTLHFILVRPALPENVGAAARALNTMGFCNLRLVAPCDHLCIAARKLAHGSETILEQALVFGSLKAALADIDFAACATARPRHLHSNSVLLLQKLPALLAEKSASLRSVAIVFGTEDSGLSNAEIELCDLLTTIPMAKAQPSLNLAQAVMVYAHTLFEASRAGKHPRPATQDKSQYRALTKRLSAYFKVVGVRENSLFLKKIYKRMALLPQQDIKLLHFLQSRLEETAGLRNPRLKG
ncbi:MAG: tRNA/rRNA methyltransferase [Fibrobacterota bacterium]